MIYILDRKLIIVKIMNVSCISSIELIIFVHITVSYNVFAARFGPENFVRSPYIWHFGLHTAPRSYKISIPLLKQSVIHFTLVAEMIWLLLFYPTSAVVVVTFLCVHTLSKQRKPHQTFFKPLFVQSARI